MAYGASTLGDLEPGMNRPNSNLVTVTDPPKTKRQQAWHLIARHATGVAISLACLWLVFRTVHIGEVISQIVAIDLRLVCFGILSLSIGYALRILRWQVMLAAAGAVISPSKCIAPFLGSIALNNVLPFRAGDAVRALVFPKALGISRATATASLAMERALDLAVLLFALAAGALSSSHSALLTDVGRIFSFLAITCISSIIFVMLVGRRLGELCGRARSHLLVARRLWLSSLLEFLGRVITDLSLMTRPTLLTIAAMLSLGVWAGESGLFLSLLAGLGISSNLASAVVAMAAATLSTLLPSTPGYVGPFHAAAFWAVHSFTGANDQAAAFAVLAHFSVWAPTSIAGAIAILLRPGLFRAEYRAPN
jgi:glycosyltransferase 2 family protein